jgi:hypothetical protein
VVDDRAGRGVPGGWSHDSSDIDTTPCYARPGDEGVNKAKRRIFQIAECIVSNVVILDSAMIRLVISAESVVTVAEAMWAIHELTIAGGLVAVVRSFVPANVYSIADDNPPAGLSMAAGPLHMIGNDSHWGVLWFSIDHKKLNQLQGPNEPTAKQELTHRERCVVDAIGDSELSGPEIAKKSGFTNNSRFRECLSGLVKREVLKKGPFGYRRGVT